MIKYVSSITPYKIVCQLIFIIVLFIFSYTNNINISKDLLFLLVIFFVYTAWKVFYSNNYRICEFRLENKKLKLQIHKGLKISNINVDINEIQKFLVNVNVDYKRLFTGVFEIDTQIDLTNGQHFEMKNITKRKELFKTFGKAVKEIPNSNILINSNFDKGEYSQEALNNYLISDGKSNSISQSLNIGFAIIIAIMILAFITMFLQ